MSDEARPFPKSSQLARGERRRARKVASRKEWAAITAAKTGPCRVCNDPGTNGRVFGKIEFHHLVSRAHGGDDVSDNVVPLCPFCHERITSHAQPYGYRLAAALTDAECAYLIGKLGEGALERLYGVGR